MKRYLRGTGLSSKALAERCGVSHSRMYMVRERNVGPENAGRIASGVRAFSGSLREKLELKADIMGEPGNLVRAYLGGTVQAAEILGEYETDVSRVIDNRLDVPHAPGVRVVKKLEEMGAPQFVIEDVRARAVPKYVPPGRVTHRQSGLEARNKRARALFNLRLFKPETAQALERANLSKKEIRERAGVGREAVRKALYQSCGSKAAGKIAGVLAAELDLSEGEREVIREELMRAPQENF